MSNVSRAVYQKLKEENKKLLRQIFILTDDKYTLSTERIFLVSKWKEKWEKERQFNNIMKEIATDYFKEHPEHDIMSPNFKLPAKYTATQKNSNK